MHPNDDEGCVQTDSSQQTERQDDQVAWLLSDESLARKVDDSMACMFSWS